VRGLGRRPFSAANAHHGAQFGVPAFVPKRNGLRNKRALGRVSPQPFLVSEQHGKGSGDLPMTVAIFSRRKCSCKAHCFAPYFYKLVWAVEAFDKRFTIVGHQIGLAPFARQRRVKSRSRQPPEPSTVYASSRCLFRKSDRIDRAVDCSLSVINSVQRAHCPKRNPARWGSKGGATIQMIGINCDRDRQSPCDPVPCRDRDP
jgi:hypothetical protein